VSNKELIPRIIIGLVVGILMSWLGGVTSGVFTGTVLLVGGAFIAVIFTARDELARARHFFARIAIISFSIMLGSFIPKIF